MILSSRKEIYFNRCYWWIWNSQWRNKPFSFRKCMNNWIQKEYCSENFCFFSLSSSFMSKASNRIDSDERQNWTLSIWPDENEYEWKCELIRWNAKFTSAWIQLKFNRPSSLLLFHIKILRNRAWSPKTEWVHNWILLEMEH